MQGHTTEKIIRCLIDKIIRGYHKRKALGVIENHIPIGGSGSIERTAVNPQTVAVQVRVTVISPQGCL